VSDAPGERGSRGDSFLAVGVDVGGTKIAAGVVSFPRGRVESIRVVPTRAERGGDAVLADVLGLVKELAHSAGSSAGAAGAIGVGLCELVDRSGAVVSANCIDWTRAQVVERLSRVAPATLEADVRAAALAEALFGSGRGLHSFLYTTIGTGISCSLVLDGKPYLGSRGLTGTLASAPIPCAGRAPLSTAPSTLEELASGPGLVARWNRASRGRAAHAEELLAAAAAGDSLAVETVETGAEALGAALGMLVGTLDPEAVIVGGGLGLSGGLFGVRLEDSTRRHIWSPLQRGLPILRAATGTHAGVIGAAAAAWKQHCR
jgi:predicted NBD/HSP70 family sugar kinase